MPNFIDYCRITFLRRNQISGHTNIQKTFYLQKQSCKSRRKANAVFKKKYFCNDKIFLKHYIIHPQGSNLKFILKVCNYCHIKFHFVQKIFNLQIVYRSPNCFFAPTPCWNYLTSKMFLKQKNLEVDFFLKLISQWEVFTLAPNSLKPSLDFLENC